jgi:hypothetical protein
LEIILPSENMKKIEGSASIKSFDQLRKVRRMKFQGRLWNCANAP